MNLSRITALLFLFVSACSTSSCLQNKRDGSPAKNRNRRIALNEYLVPPPLPKLRTGRVANPSATEPPGYFSQLMGWLNPFSFGPSPPTLPKSSAFLENPHPPPPQLHDSPSFDLHPPLPPAPSFHSTFERQINLPLYPPLGPPPVQHPAPLYNAPPGIYSRPPFHPPPGPVQNLPPLNPPPGPAHNFPPLNPPPSPVHNLPPLSPLPGPLHNLPPLNPPPVPHLHLYNAPPTILHDINHGPPSSKNVHATYTVSKKGKPCSPCNKVPWTPMEGNAPFQEGHPQISNAYLPPSSSTNHDIQHAASNEFRVPDFPQEPVEQNVQHSLDSSIVYPQRIAPVYKAESFDLAPPNSQVEIVNHFEPPTLHTVLPDQDQTNYDMNNEHYNDHASDLTSSGTQVNQGHVSAISQSHEVEIRKELTDYKGSFDPSIHHTQQPNSGSIFDQEYRKNSPIAKQQNEDFNRPEQYNQNIATNLIPSSVESHNFASQSGTEYRDSFESNTGANIGLNYLPSDLNPSISVEASSFNNRATANSNYQYGDDSSPTGSVVKDSGATTQTPMTSSSLNEGPVVHFEESPLLDLTKKDESPIDTQWSTSTSSYTNDDLSDSTAKTTTAYSIDPDKIHFPDSFNFIRPTESYSSSLIRNINSNFAPVTSTVGKITENNRNHQIGTSTTNSQSASQQGVSYVPTFEPPRFLWPSLFSNILNSRNESSDNQQSLNYFAEKNHSFPEIQTLRQEDKVDLQGARDTFQKQQNVKRNKQVQVIIPYTSDYTPIPFQQSHGDWSIKTNFERTVARKVPTRSESNADNYIQQESRNDIRVVNKLDSQYNVNHSNKFYGQSSNPSLTTIKDLKSVTTKANNSIDVRRLQKNIDNWTIQEYSKPTTSSTILPSSLHPYLLPSKKIPTEYLTTTEPGDRTSPSKDHNESVKTYSLAGFSFNEVEHEGSASNRIEETRAPVNAVRIDSTKTTGNSLQSINKSSTGQKSTWETYSVSLSPVNKERVYVVTPQPIQSSPTNDFEKQKGEGKRENSQQSNDAVIIDDVNRGKNNLSEFEAIEKAYQVLPQAVNNLAVASTGKENVPLWGIMEHEEFASINLDENDGEAAEEVDGEGPVLYTGHSKVSRAKR